MSDAIIQGLIVAGITAVATSVVNGLVTASHLRDLTARIERIEKYLNGLLKAADK